MTYGHDDRQSNAPFETNPWWRELGKWTLGAGVLAILQLLALWWRAENG